MKHYLLVEIDDPHFNTQGQALAELVQDAVQISVLDNVEVTLLSVPAGTDATKVLTEGLELERLLTLSDFVVVYPDDISPEREAQIEAELAKFCKDGAPGFGRDGVLAPKLDHSLVEPPEGHDEL